MAMYVAVRKYSVQLNDADMAKVKALDVDATVKETDLVYMAMVAADGGDMEGTFDLVQYNANEAGTEHTHDWQPSSDVGAGERVLATVRYETHEIYWNYEGC